MSYKSNVPAGIETRHMQNIDGQANKKILFGDRKLGIK
jgi:hypothetical protein